MALINTSSFNSDLLPGLVKKWFGDYNDLPELYSQYMQVERSDQAYEIEATLTPMGALQKKNQGSVLRLDSSQESYKPVYTHLTYALGFAITKEMMADGHAFKNAKKFVEMLRRSSRVTKEILAASVINNAGTAGFTMQGGDGVILAYNAHPTRGGLQSNILASGADLSEAALEAMNTQIMNAVDNRGLRIGLMMDTLLVSPGQQAEAYRILNSTKRPGTADNDANFVGDNNLIKKVVVNPYFSSNTQWQVTTTATDGIKMKIRQDAEIDQDNDFATKNALFSVDMRLSVGWSDFRGIYFSL